MEEQTPQKKKTEPSTEEQTLTKLTDSKTEIKVNIQTIQYIELYAYYMSQQYNGVKNFEDYINQHIQTALFIYGYFSKHLKPQNFDYYNFTITEQKEYLQKTLINILENQSKEIDTNRATNNFIESFKQFFKINDSIQATPGQTQQPREQPKPKRQYKKKSKKTKNKE